LIREIDRPRRRAGKPLLTATEIGTRLIPVNATIGVSGQVLSTTTEILDRNKIPLGACHDQHYDEFRL
jgi:hypothetical protein